MPGTKTPEQLPLDVVIAATLPSASMTLTWVVPRTLRGRRLSGGGPEPPEPREPIAAWGPSAASGPSAATAPSPGPCPSVSFTSTVARRTNDSGDPSRGGWDESLSRPVATILPPNDGGGFVRTCPPR